MHRQVRFMARSAASYGVAVLHNLSPGKHLKQTCFFMDQIDLMDLMDKKCCFGIVFVRCASWHAVPLHTASAVLHNFPGNI